MLCAGNPMTYNKKIGLKSLERERWQMGGNFNTRGRQSNDRQS